MYTNRTGDFIVLGRVTGKEKRMRKEETDRKNIELYMKYGCTKRTKEYIYTCTKCGCKCSVEGSYSVRGNNLVCRFCYESEGIRNGKDI